MFTIIICDKVKFEDEIKCKIHVSNNEILNKKKYCLHCVNENSIFLNLVHPIFFSQNTFLKKLKCKDVVILEYPPKNHVSPNLPGGVGSLLSW